MATPGARSKPLFISYSHKDQEWYEQFAEILHASALGAWSDSKIEVSQNWDTTIQDALSEARIALLLISPAFLSSEYIRNRELPRILHAHKEEKLAVMWVRVRPIPESIIPKELRALQTFDIQGSATRSLSSLTAGEAASEISAICEHIIGQTEFEGSGQSH